jgi:hypothetical protein
LSINGGPEIRFSFFSLFSKATFYLQATKQLLQRM